MPVGDVLVCAILGAAVLAIVQLWTAHRRQEKTIAQLHAELTAQRIAALSGAGPLPAPATDGADQEPTRRKRHLALYIGGGAIAAIASLGGRLRSFVRGHTAVVAASATVMVGTAAAAALYLTSGTGAADQDASYAPQTRHSPIEGDKHPAPSGEAPDNDATGPEDEPVVVPLDAGTPRPITEPDSPSAQPSDTSAEDSDDEQSETDEDEKAPAPADSGEPTAAPTADQPTPPAPEPSQSPTSSPSATEPPEPAPSPPPSPSPTKPAPSPSPDDGLCIVLPPLLELCIG
ncbi:hypothetical protein ACFWC2_14220 [Streptomyces diastaticus]|uniref:hypothetical protein n=1 Tax=Streptomyces diastaticus TaxID=1956 RepID=UPI00364BA3A9